MSEFQKDELSLEETNKLRVSLGLKPLAPDSDDEKEISAKERSTKDDDIDDDDPLKNQEEKAAKNYAAFQQEARRKREEDEVRERIAKAQNRRELNRRLQGRTLGEVESTEARSSDAGTSSVDAKKWLKEQRKKAKQNAARRLQEEAEAEAEALANVKGYDSNDLRDIRVGHDVEEFALDEKGGERILTLRDSKVLDNDEDELMDETLDQAERDRRNEERKRGPKKYTGLDDEEFGAQQVGSKRGILSKYDDEIEQNGTARESGSGFRLGGETRTKMQKSEDKRREADRMLNRSLLNLDYAKNEEVSDYLREGDVGFKKPKMKKKNRQAATRIRFDEDDAEDGRATAQADTAMLDGTAAVSANGADTRRNKEIDLNVNDDDDLSRSLAVARRKQARRAFQKITPEMIARNLAEQRAAEEAEGAGNGESFSPSSYATADIPGKDRDPDEEAAGLTFDETSEFVRNIQSAREASTRQESTPRQYTMKVEASQTDLPLYSPPPQEGIDATTLLQTSSDGVKKEESDEDMEEEADANDAEENENRGEPSEALLSSSGGLAATLNLLRNQGLMKQITPEEQEREREQKEYDLWMAQRRAEDEVREAELALSKAQGSAKDQAQREYENRMREMEDARRAQDKFKDYKPDIDIKYHDEFGRVLNNHEAWKRLSHVFHGKAPGRKKQEQRLQRIEEEKKREKMLAGDTPSGMSKAFTDRAERSGQAHMVLGVGARNNAPQDAGFLGPNTAMRSSAAKGKLRHIHDEQGERQGQDSTFAPPFGRDAESDVAGVTSMVPRSTTAKTKAGFAPIKRPLDAYTGDLHPVAGSPSSFSPIPHSSEVPKSKFKLAFGAKRPAPSPQPSDDSSERASKQLKS